MVEFAKLPDDLAQRIADYKRKHPQTNADRIRSMTDEELANHIMFLLIAFDFRDPIDILDWLKQEADHA